MRKELYTKLVLTIIAITLVVIALKPYVASRKVERIDEAEIMADVGRDMAAMSDKINADEKKEADRQREVQSHPYRNARSVSPSPPNETQPSQTSRPQPVTPKTSPHEVLAQQVQDGTKAREDHGMIASIRGGPLPPGVNSNLPPLSDGLGPVRGPNKSMQVPVPLIVMGREDIARARSNPGHEGHHFDNAPYAKQYLSLNITAVQAVLGPDGRPIEGTNYKGEPITLIVIPDGRGIAGYIPSDAFNKLE